MFISKVQFRNMSNLAAVQTRGESSTQYVTSYRLEYSADCIAFVRYLDANGNDVVKQNKILLIVFYL